MAPSKLTQLKGLYVITDANLLTDRLHLLNAVEAAILGGAQLVQYRNKKATLKQQREQIYALKELCDQYDRQLLINDQLALAEEIRCGVHLGQQDTPLEQARDRLGPDAVIGITCHNDIELAANAIEYGASYIAFGRLYPSTTKPDAPPADLDTITQCKQRWPDTPIAGIGGITINNASQVITAGADMVAVVNAIWNTNDIKGTSHRLQQLFKSEH